ncbi:MAG TPA: hypothetical protein VM658_20150, partial [bacterium]|nr:hypothetical protein [bacterium]
DRQVNHDISWRPNKKQLQGSDSNRLGEPPDGSAKRKTLAPKPSSKLILGALGVLAVFRCVYFGQHCSKIV